MKQLKLSFILLTLLIVGSSLEVSAVKRKAWSSSDGVYYLATRDELEDVYTVDGSITFKGDKNGTIPAWRDCGVVFAPKNEGEVIMITVNTCTLAGENYLLVYDGAITKVGYNTSDGVDQSKYLPAGWVKKLQSQSGGTTYISQSSDGKLSFGFHSKNPEGQEFSITVSSVTPKDMTYTSATALTNMENVNRGAKDQKIFGVEVMTEGIGNPLTMNELQVSTAALAGNGMVSNLRLYNGSTFNAAQLLAQAAPGETLTATDVVLHSGSNQFFVVADVSQDAKGTLPGLEASSLKVAGETRTLTATQGNDIKINNVILMPAEAKTYIIDDDNAFFYDDGGKDGKISEQFTGTVTFVPATQGKAIKIDFSKLAIFNTSSVGKNDILKFYNGRTADESKLITTLLKEAEIVKSTADDGSMTVTLTSTTGVPADGWEAIVSQFQPGPMTFAGLSATASENQDVSAGQEGVPMLVIDVITDNQNNALKVTDFNLTTTDAKNMAQAHIYYLGKKNVFATTHEFGSTAVSGNTVKVNGEQELIEGHNYFAIVLDLNDKALNGEKINLTLAGVTVDGSVKNTAETVTAERKVSNVCFATEGIKTYIIRDKWTFCDEPSPYNPNKYNATDKNSVVTFIPAEPGYLAQIDFSSFNVLYSASSYGTKATFQIYSGTTMTAENLLWELNSSDQAKTGPGKVLRSKAADGALTICFNPGTTSSYYTAEGWIATVSPYKDHDMTVTEVVPHQTSTADLAVGAKGEPIIDFEVVADGSLNAKTIKEINLKFTGIEAIEKVKVLYSADRNSIDNAVTFGEATPTNAENLTMTGTARLQEGNNHFWVLIDVKDNAKSGTAVDAQLLSLKDLTGVTTTVNADAEGQRIIKNEMNISSGNKVVTVIDPLMFYDDGGKDGPSVKGFDGTITFVPGKPGHSIEIDTKEFSVGSGKFYLYEGSEVNDEKLIGSFSYNSGPGSLISDAKDNAFTVRYTGPTSSTSSFKGFAIEVKLHELKPFQVDTIAVEPASTSDVVRGTSAATMERIHVVVTGDRGSLKLGNVKFNTAGTTDLSNITNAKLFFTGKNNSFSDKNLVATATTLAAQSELTTETPVEISERGDFYFWLTYEIAASATAGNKVAAQVTHMIVDGASVPISTTVVERAIKAGLKGNFVIGSSANATYKTFAEATQAIAGGIEGPVTFTVEPGTYPENVKISRIEGVSAEHRLSFIGATDDASDVVISGAGFDNPAYGGFKEGMFLIDSTSYVTLKRMSFVPKDQSFPAAIHVYNQSRHVTLDSIAVSATPVNSSGGTYGGISLVKTEAKNENCKNNDFFTVQNSTFNGGHIALYLGGTNYIKLTREEGLVAKNNTISEAGSKGIYVTNEDNALIDNNVIYQSSTSKADYHGIDITRMRGKSVISNNKITNTHGAYSSGIELRMESYGSENEPILVYNNAISITNSPSGSSAGIEIDGDNKNISVIYNTVRIAGKEGYTFFAARAKSNPRYKGITIQNNLFQNLTGSKENMFIYADYKSKPAYCNNAFTGGNVLTDVSIDSFNTLAGNTTNLIDTATFVGDTDLHLKSAGKLNAAAPHSQITTDADGKTRHDVTPTIGAYEYEEIVLADPAIEEGYPQVTTVGETAASVKTKWNVSGKLYAKVEKHVVPGPVPVGRKLARSPQKVVTAEDLLAMTPANYSAGAELTSQFTSLEPGTEYVAYFLLESALDGKKSAVVESEVFVTEMHVDSLIVSLARPAATIQPGGSATIAPAITGGSEPFTYEWRDQMNQVVGTDAQITVSPEYTWGYKLTVTSADGQKAVAKTGVYVQGAAVTATFEDNFLSEESYFNGDTMNDVFYSGSYAFNVSNMTQWWYGYAMSNQTSTDFTDVKDQYHSSVGHGYNNSPNYCVGYPSGSFIEVTNNADGDNIRGVYVTNNAYAVNSMLHGDSFAKPFAKGSWFKVTAKGTKADGTTATTDFYLADYRSEDEAEHYMVTDWKWWDLSALGKVTKVTFLLSGSDTGKFGLNTPAYICLDNFNDEAPIITGIDGMNNGNGVTITTTGGNIKVTGAAGVAVYTVSGAQVSAGKTEIDVVPGVYIVVANGQAHKVLVK